MYLNENNFFQGPDTQQTSTKWSRPSPPSLNPVKDKIEFQQLDIDHYTGKLFIAVLTYKRLTIKTRTYFLGTKQTFI